MTKVVPTPASDSFETPQLFLNLYGQEFVAAQMPKDVRTLLEAASQTRGTVPEEVSEPVKHTSGVAALALQGELEFGPVGFVDKIDSVQVAFGWFTKKWLYDEVGDYNPALVSDEERKWMQPGKILPILLPKIKSGSQSIDGQYIDGVLVNNVEYELIPRSPKHLGTSVRAKYLSTKADINHDVVLKSLRKRMHLMEDMVLPELARHGALLVERRDDIKGLRMMAENPGMRRYKAGNVKTRLAGFWNEVDNILDVLQTQRVWTEEQKGAAKGAILLSLTTDSQASRVKNFKAWFGITDTYLGERIKLIGSRDSTTKKLLDQYTNEYAKLQ